MIYRIDGAGNAFVLAWEGEQPDISLCDCDGLIWLKPSASASAHMTFFNPDGKTAALCGNGLRAAARFLIEKGEKAPFTIETEQSLHRISVEGGLIGTEMPQHLPFKKIEVDGVAFFYTEVGVPHAYHIVDAVDTFDLESLGLKFVSHPFFSNGCNINILEKGPPAKLRTFERGVNRETLACGTGAFGAAKLVGEDPVVIQAPGGRLEIRGEWLFGPTSAPYQLER